MGMYYLVAWLLYNWYIMYVRHSVCTISERNIPTYAPFYVFPYATLSVNRVFAVTRHGSTKYVQEYGMGQHTHTKYTFV